MMLGAYAWLVIAPVIGLTCAVLLHLLLARFTGGERAYGCALRGCVGGFAATLGICLAALANLDVAATDWIALPLFNLAIYGALAFGYINFVGLSIASLRIRVLQELLAHPEGMSRDSILENYHPRLLIDNRIARLTAGRQLVERDGRFYGGRAGVLWIARVMNVLKFAVLGRR